MRVILFIGHHKVGSTSLQDFLSRNTVALARSGILYPAVDFEGMALMLATAISGKDPKDGLPINAREPHNALAFKMLAGKEKGRVPSYHVGLPSSPQMLRAIRKQVAFLKPHTVILAAEVFANFAPTGPSLITQLTGVFPEADFTVLATLRRIDAYLASWHGQRLKFGHELAPLRGDGMKGYFRNIHFDYRLMLEGWMQALPEAKVILRDYSAVRDVGGSIPDFVAQSGLKLPKRLRAEQRTNESLHRGVYEIARRGNKMLTAAQARELRQFLRAETPKLDLPPSDQIELFGAQNRARMVERFEPIHAFLGQALERAGGQAPFFADQDEVAKCLAIPEMEVYAATLEKVVARKNALEDDAIGDFLDALATRQRAMATGV